LDIILKQKFELNHNITSGQKAATVDFLKRCAYFVYVTETKGQLSPV